MSLTPKHKKSQPAWLDVTVFAVVLAFLCFSVHILLGFTSRSAQKVAAPSVAASQPEIETAERQPASQSPAVQKTASTEVLRLPCLGQAASAFSSEARLLQIHAPACSEDLLHLNGWKGSNESSGEEILIFVNAKEKTLSTSYFSLRDGVNKIVLTHELGKGRSKTQTIEVSKRGSGE